MRSTLAPCVISAAIALTCVGSAIAESAPGRVIVKYRDLNACAECLVARHAAFAPYVGDASLDQLQARLGVRGARPVFPHGTRRGRAVHADRLAAVRARFPGRAARAPATAREPDLSEVYVLELAADVDVEQAAADLAANPHVAWAHPDRRVHVDFTPNDPLFAQQWGPTRIAAPLAWDTANGAGTVIAVVDTGVDRTHPDLAANMWANPGEIAANGIDDDGNGFVDDVVGWDFVSNDASPDDHHGHGTHVSGIAAARTNNALGIAGLAFGARVMAVKGLGDDGSGWISDLAAAIVYAAENGADVINNSWGGGGLDQVLVDAVDTARALGAVVVAAAGNSAGAVDSFEPARIPGVIAVGATDQTDAIASFSNFGDALSVAAPGVSVLSSRPQNATGIGSNNVVQQIYQSLSGTSMASPHVAGLAAVLLSAMPALTVEQVRWQLELNADQPGFPGFEGQPWNPHFGWGRINAAHVFDPVPVTTRLSDVPPLFHGIVGATTPAALSLAVVFTTIDPVAWSVTAPPWLLPSMPTGNGSATITFDLDATTLTPGALSGSIDVSAASAVDGGGSKPVTAYLHRDERAGPVSIVTADTPTLQGIAEIASDGVGSLITWEELPIGAVKVAHLDGGGTLTPAAVATQAFPYKFAPVLAFDGRNYLIVWYEVTDTGSGWYSSVDAMRVAADGTPVDATPFLIADRKSSYDEVLRDPTVAFDGQAYLVVWEDLRATLTRVQTRVVGTDGSLRGKKAVQIYPDKGGRTPQKVDPSVGCVNGRCLVAWNEFDGETAPDGHYIDKAYGMILQHGVASSQTATRVSGDLQTVRRIASDGTNFLITGFTRVRCPSGALQDVPVAGRVTTAGVPLDLAPIRLDHSTPDCPQSFAWDIAFDGTNYVIPFTVLAPTPPPGFDFGYYLFTARLSPGGTVLDDEVPGLLLHEQPTIARASLAATKLESIAVWSEHTTNTRDTVKLRHVLRHADAPDYPAATIGQIGALAIGEEQDLLRTIVAPAGFDPGTTTLAATGLPPGAIFDAPTGAFRWRPYGTEAGSYPGVTFTATSGAQVASETVTVTVGEAVRALSGRVRLANGTPVTDARLQISGVPHEKPVAFTDRDGRYRLTGLAPKSYAVKLDSLSKKRYRVLGPIAKAALASGDAVLADIVVAPK